MTFVLLVLLYFFGLTRFHRRLRAQEREITELRRALDALMAERVVVASKASIAPPNGVTEPATATPAADSEAGAVGAPLVNDVEDEPAHAPPPPLAGPKATRADRWKEIEASLASHWLNWLGGATLALAAAFFIKLSVDYGWLGPGVRVTLGELFGLGLMIGGEWLRRRPSQRAIAAISPDHVPPALTATGLFVAFASLYGGYALFHLLAPPIAFVGLAALSLLGIALSLLQGPVIAALGLLAGYVTPMLIASDDPTAWGLFAYLLALNAAGMAVVLYRGWRWLGWGALAGAALWPMLWLGVSFGDEDALPLGLYCLLSLAFFLMPATFGAVMEPLPAPEPPLNERWRAAARAWALPWARNPADRMAVAATGLFALLLAGVTRADGQGGMSLAAVALFALVAMDAGRRCERIAVVAWIAAASLLPVLVPWDLPAVPTLPTGAAAVGQPAVSAEFLRTPDEVLRFLWVSGGFALLFGAGGFAILWRARRVTLWAALSALVPLALLVLAYARVAPPQTAVGWPVAALGLAALLVGATGWLERHRHRPGAMLGMAVFAAAAVGAITLGATMTLREAWLTVALAAQLPVLAWLERRLDLRDLRGIALLVASVVLVRLALNPFVLDYDGYVWIAYGYGLPAAAFLLAARWMRGTGGGTHDGDDLTVSLLEAGALAFITLMLGLGIHRWLNETLAAPPSTLVEMSLHSLCWLGLALLLVVDRRWRDRPAAIWGRRLLVGLAAVVVGLVQVLALNPLWTGEPVGDWPVVNGLLLAYGMPALLGWLFVRLDPPPKAELRAVAPAAALALFALELALEIRRAFHGPVLSGTATSNAEWYVYSATFLLLAVGILVAALRFGWVWMRHAGMALLLAVVAKVFLSDMRLLEGLYRVASFLGLGASLIGIGYLHQHLGRRTAPPATGSPPDDPFGQRMD